VVKLLLDHGADPNARDNKQDTPLHVYGSIAAVVKLLLDHGADPNARNIQQDTPILKAFNGAVVKLLLDHGADAKAMNSDENTMITNAIIYRDMDMLKVLLEHEHGFDVNARDNMQRTALHYAMFFTSENEDMVKQLLDLKADVNVRDEHQNTPLHLAKNVEVARILVNRGAQLTAVNEDGQNALHIAAKRASWNIVWFNLCLFFVSRGLDPYIADNEGETALTLYGTHDIAPNQMIDLWDDDWKEAEIVELLAAHEAYKQRVRDEHWKKNWPLLNTLTSSGLRPMNAEVAALAAQQAASDKSVKLPGVPRITKAENIAFLHQVNSFSVAYNFHDPTSHSSN